MNGVKIAKTMVLAKRSDQLLPPTIYSSAHSIEISEASIPWKAKGKDYEPGLFGLDREIRDFVSYITATPDERWARDLVIARVRNCIHNLWPNARVEVCGSFQTDLYLPTSDIDLVIFGNWDPDRLPLDLLRVHIENHRIASSIKVLSRATVPILKLIEKETEIQVDISFNMNNSLRAVNLIAEYLARYNCLKYLVLVLKQFLQQRELNEVFTGGLGSYALILMCYSFLQHHVQRVDIEKINLAVLLIEFLELYGQRFNYNTTAIRLTEGGVYCPKDDFMRNSEMLSIQDPLNPDNDLGRRTFAMAQVRQSFEYAYTVLKSAVLPQYQEIHSAASRSILGRIIRIPQRTLEKRQQLQDYANKVRMQLSQKYPVLTSSVFLPSPVHQSAKPTSTNNQINPNVSAPLQQPPLAPQAASESPVVVTTAYLATPIGFIGGLQQFIAPTTFINQFPIAVSTAPATTPAMNYLNQQIVPVSAAAAIEPKSCSSCSPHSSSTVSSAIEDSSEEAVSGPEKQRRPHQEAPSAAGDRPESPGSKLLLDDAAVKSLIRHKDECEPKPEDWPPASACNVEPTIVSITKNLHRKNRSQARKFDPNHFRLRGNHVAQLDTAANKVNDNSLKARVTKGLKAPKNQEISTVPSTAARSSSEETQQGQRNNHQTRSKHIEPVSPRDSNGNFTGGSKRKRLQSRKTNNH